MVKLNMDLNLGLVANYDKLMSSLADCVALQNLIKVFNNDRNTYNLFLACPVSVEKHLPLGESEFEKQFGINTVVTFDLSGKGIWIYPDFKGEEPTLKVFCSETEDLSLVNLVKSFCLELRCYTEIGAEVCRSQLKKSTLLALDIDTVIVTNSKIMFGVKQ